MCPLSVHALHFGMSYSVITTFWRNYSVHRFKLEVKKAMRVPCGSCKKLPAQDATKSCLDCKASFCNECFKRVHPWGTGRAQHEYIGPTHNYRPKVSYCVMFFFFIFLLFSKKNTFYYFNGDDAIWIAVLQVFLETMHIKYVVFRPTVWPRESMDEMYYRLPIIGQGSLQLNSIHIHSVEYVQPDRTSKVVAVIAFIIRSPKTTLNVASVRVIQIFDIP